MHKNVPGPILVSLPTTTMAEQAKKRKTASSTTCSNEELDAHLEVWADQLQQNRCTRSNATCVLMIHPLRGGMPSNGGSLRSMETLSKKCWTIGWYSANSLSSAKPARFYGKVFEQLLPPETARVHLADRGVLYEIRPFVATRQANEFVAVGDQIKLLQQMVTFDTNGGTPMSPDQIREWKRDVARCVEAVRTFMDDIEEECDL